MDLTSITIRAAAILFGILLVVSASIGTIGFVRVLVFLLLACVLAHFANIAYRRKEENNVISFTITNPHTQYFSISSTTPGWDMEHTLHETFQQVDITGPDGIVYVTLWAPRPKVLVLS